MNNLQWLEIDLNNLKHNVKNLKSLISKKTKFMAVVKSNAYGHGMLECAKAAVEAGADWLGVVNLDEAVRLRTSEVKPPILVLGYVKPEDFKIAAENNISIAITNMERLSHCSTVSLLKNQTLKIHLKIETGISRLGFSENEWQKLINELKKLPKNIIIEGIYSHFASVEEYDLAYARKQLNKFNEFVCQFDNETMGQWNNVIKHMAASAATIILPESHFDMVRCGIAIYGLWPSKEVKTSFKTKNKKLKSEFLKPVLTYKTKIVQIKQVKRGECIGYGCSYLVEKTMTIAVIPVGYAEGFDRGFSNPAPLGNKSGEVLIKGIRCPIVGRICMNMLIIDISRLIFNFQFSISKLYEEIVVLIGKQEAEEISADEWAEKLGTINYEVTTRIPESIKRIYI